MKDLRRPASRSAPPWGRVGKTTAPVDAQRKAVVWQLLRMRNFRLLWAAGALSAIGDQFDLITFPWLVLLVTGDPLAVGAVIAVSGVPTVFFMLLGGSLVDRFSPRAMMQVSNILRVALSVSLATLILTGLTELWLIYLFALLKGISDSFYYPAQLAIVPSIVPSERLRQSNAVIQTTAELGGLVGPMLAGGLIAFFGTGGERSRLAAACRIECPAVRRRAISHRSSMVIWLY